MKISVGDLAAQIMAQDEVMSKGAAGPPTLSPDPSFYSANATEQAPDISQVEVPNDFVSSIVEGKAPIIPEVEVQEEEEVVVSSPQPLSEVTELKSLIEEVKDLLIEVKQTLTEMTTVGTIGVNMAGPGKKTKKKKGETQEEDPMKKILKRIKGRKATG